MAAFATLVSPCVPALNAWITVCKSAIASLNNSSVNPTTSVGIASPSENLMVILPARLSCLLPHERNAKAARGSPPGRFRHFF